MILIRTENGILVIIQGGYYGKVGELGNYY